MRGLGLGAEARRLLAEDAQLQANGIRDRIMELPERGPAGPDAVPPPRVRVPVDTLVRRVDLGDDDQHVIIRTLVLAYTLVPYGLEHLPRVPVPPPHVVATARVIARGSLVITHDTHAMSAADTQAHDTHDDTRDDTQAQASSTRDTHAMDMQHAMDTHDATTQPMSTDDATTQAITSRDDTTTTKRRHDPIIEQDP